jgi:hypothetical protein
LNPDQNHNAGIMDVMVENFQPLATYYVISASGLELLLNPNVLTAAPSLPEPLPGTRILHKESAKEYEIWIEPVLFLDFIIIIIIFSPSPSSFISLYFSFSFLSFLSFFYFIL